VIVVDGATHSHKDDVESNGGCLENAVDGATHSHKDGVESNGQFTITCHLDCLLKVVIKWIIKYQISGMD
jgi:hypothetical protein